MTCAHCHGLLHDYGDDISPRCMQCGRSPGSPPSQAQLRAAGIGPLVTKQETQGLRLKGKEYSPDILRLWKPLKSV